MSEFQAKHERSSISQEISLFKPSAEEEIILIKKEIA